jgi:membrane-bound lytic murein transglycosylase MltF
MKNRCNLVIAEVSYPSTGLGIELGWASTYLIPIVCIYRKGSEISGSLRQVSTKFLKYSNNKELISAIKKALRTEYPMSAHK